VIFHTYEADDGDFVMEVDAEAIDYLIDGLTELRGKEPGESLTSPSLVQSTEGEPQGVGDWVLLRAADEE
jgi:hypothetical protein